MVGEGGGVTDDNRWTRGGWRSPAGISSITAVLGVVIAGLGLFLSTRSEPAPTVTTPTVPVAPTAMSATYLFVYGTTMPGHLRYKDIQHFVAKADRDSAEGQLFDSGAGYPAAKFGAGSGTIEGYVLRLRPDRVDEALRTMTAMEGGLFHPTKITTIGGVTATAYEWIDTTEGLTPLTGMWSGPEA
jgi:gamma-glutamylcyclotransferase (GGCT)/AIG2-like uncharacterized protein YtfP